MILYKCKSDPSALVPEYEEQYPPTGEISTTPYEPLDDLNGYVILDYNEAYDDYNKAQLYGKYYTITSREKDTGQRVRLNLTVDVMKTYADEIASCNVIVKRTGSPPPDGDREANGWNALIQDAKNVLQSNNSVIEVAFDPDYNNGVTDFGWDNRPYLLCIGSDVPKSVASQVVGPTIPEFLTRDTSSRG